MAFRIRHHHINRIGLEGAVIFITLNPYFSGFGVRNTMWKGVYVPSSIHLIKNIPA